MKFSDGNWMHQPGVQAHHPAEAYYLNEQDGTLVVHAPTRQIRHRGDTLQGPMLTITLSSPMEDVIKVRIEHYAGAAERGPVIPIQSNAHPKIQVSIEEKSASLKSGQLEARLKRGDTWELAFIGGGRTITKSGFRGIGFIQHATQGTFVHEQLDLGVGEQVYGLGERFTAFTKNGQVVENWNKDGGTGCDQAYKSVPFYLTNRGYGVLVNELGPVSFEVASEKVSRVQFSIPGERLEYFVIHGPTPKDVLRKLTALTGRPALPPAWSFGLWLTTSFTTSYDEATVTSFIEGMKERDLPLHVFHFDCFWMRAFEWSNLEWDPKAFPDPIGMMRRLHKRGLKICVWINPYIAQRSRLFEEGRRGGYLLKKPNGEVWQTDQWQPGMAIVDFTNPQARAWFAEHLRQLVEIGVDCFKTDFGERIPTDVVWFDGSDPQRMHNYYSVIYNEVVFGVLERSIGRGEAVVFARSATIGGQRLPVHWGGDCNSTFESMAESLRGGLSLSLCGFGFWSHDIGGFEGLPPAAIYKRWVAFGLLSSHSRLHGSTSYRVPWNYDNEACDVLRSFTKLKCRLMPYLFGAAVEAHRDGIPMMRAMVLEHPDDPACDTLDRQYYLGSSLLVVPVFSEAGLVDYYLPAGTWTNLFTGEVVSGGRWHRSKHDFLSLPLFARENSIIAVGTRDDRPDYDYLDGTTLRVFALSDGGTAACHIPTTGGERGARVTVRRGGADIEIGIDAPSTAVLKVQLHGIPAVANVKGASAASDAAGVILTVDGGVRSVQVRIAGA